MSDVQFPISSVTNPILYTLTVPKGWSKSNRTITVNLPIALTLSGYNRLATSTGITITCNPSTVTGTVLRDGVSFDSLTISNSTSAGIKILNIAVSGANQFSYSLYWCQLFFTYTPPEDYIDRVYSFRCNNFTVSISAGGNNNNANFVATSGTYGILVNTNVSTQSFNSYVTYNPSTPFPNTGYSAISQTNQSFTYPTTLNTNSYLNVQNCYFGSIFLPSAPSSFTNTVNRLGYVYDIGTPTGTNTVTTGENYYTCPSPWNGFTLQPGCYLFYCWIYCYAFPSWAIGSMRLLLSNSNSTAGKIDETYDIQVNLGQGTGANHNRCYLTGNFRWTGSNTTAYLFVAINNTTGGSGTVNWAGCRCQFVRLA